MKYTSCDAVIDESVFPIVDVVIILGISDWAAQAVVLNRLAAQLKTVIAFLSVNAQMKHGIKRSSKRQRVMEVQDVENCR
jgi:hypothetical protein